MRNGEIRGSEVIDHGTALRAQLARMAQHDSSIILHVLRAQRTLRLMKLIPSWTTMCSNEFGSELFAALDFNALRRYRNWWELIFEITTEKQERNRIQLAIAYLVQRKLAAGYGKSRRVDPVRFNITDQTLAQRIMDATLKRYEALVPM